MSLTQLLNVAHAVLIEGIDDEAERRLDRVMAGEKLPVETQAEAFLRARGRRPKTGAPLELVKPPPPPPEGIPLAPPGVIVRQPEPTRGLEHLAAAFGQAPKPSRARPAVPRG